MNQQNAVDVYRRDAIETAPPLKLVRLLYEGAIRFLDRAVRCNPADANSQFAHWIERASAIVIELRCALDKSAAPEIADNLEQLYYFCEIRLGRAIVRRDATDVPAVRQILSNLLEGWSAIDLRAKTDAP